jgi:hypothetical protein
MTEGARRTCGWCHALPLEGRHHCLAAVAAQERSVAARGGSGDVTAADRAPHGTYGRGSPARGIVLTEHGWAHVNPELRRRLGV